MAGTTTAASNEKLFAVLDALSDRYGSGRVPAEYSVDQALDDTTATFDLLLEQLSRLPDAMQLPRLANFEQKIAAQRLVVAARVSGCSGDSRSDRRRARDALSGGAGSSRSVSRDARRAAAIAANPGLGDAVAGGSITPDAVDQLSKAADTDSGLVPTELLAAVDGLSADQTADVVERYLEDRVDVDEVEKRYQQQMAARTVRRHQRLGLAGITVEGPDQIIDAIWAHVDSDADGQYQADGGRDTPVDKRKPIDHRRFDAIHAALTGDRPAGVGSRSGRAAVVVTIDGNRFFGEPDSPLTGAQLGSGPLPGELVADYMESSPVSVLVRGADGSPLWLGRTRRRATEQQFLALAVRDRGCVLCRANITRCQAHHLMPWTAPGRGQTDVDQMALLCGRCHGDLHFRNQTLYRHRVSDGKSVWATRPATPYETPAAKPRPVQRE